MIIDFLSWHGLPDHTQCNERMWEKKIRKMWFVDISVREDMKYRHESRKNSKPQLQVLKGLFLSTYRVYVDVSGSSCAHVDVLKSNLSGCVQGWALDLPALRHRESRRGLWWSPAYLPTGQRRVCCCHSSQEAHVRVTKPTVSFT